MDRLVRPDRRCGQKSGRRHRQHQRAARAVNRTPQLNIKWDAARLSITGTGDKLLTDTEPRIILASGNGARPSSMASSVSVVPYMLMPGDVKVVADRLYNVLSKPPSSKILRRPKPRP